MKTREILFRPPSDTTDYLCADGEIKDGHRFFADDDVDASAPDSPSSPTSANKDAILKWEEGECVAQAIPAGAQILALHRPDRDSANFNIIMRLSDGAAAYAQSTMPSGNIVRFSGKEILPVSINATHHVAALGRYLIFSTPSGILFSLWHDDCYTPPLPLPAELRADFFAKSATLSGYSSAVGVLPQLHITLAVDAGISPTVSAWLNGEHTALSALSSDDRKVFDAFYIRLEKEIMLQLAQYREAAAMASLFLFPVWGKVALTLIDGNRILSSPFTKISPDGDCAILIHSHSITAGVLSLHLEIDRHPYTPMCALANDILPDFLTSVAEGIDFEITAEIPDADFNNLSALTTIYLSDGKRRLGWTPAPLTEEVLTEKVDKDDVATALFQRSIPSFTGDREKIEISGPLFCGVANVCAINSRLFLFHGTSLISSLPGLPFSLSEQTLIEGDSLIDIMPSFRSLSSGQLGEFPLYAFSADGVRALTPDGRGCYRSAQLISRDVAFPDSIIAINSAIAFLSPQGLMILEGTSTTRLSALPESLAGIPPAYILPAYHYASNCIILRPRAGGESATYNLEHKRWESAAHLYTNGLHTLWPDLYNLGGTRSLRILDSHYELPEEENNGEITKVREKNEMITTRPMKLGDFTGRKRVYGYEIVPASLLTSSLLEASDDMEHWYPLLRATGRGAYRVSGYRGRAWRYYRLKFCINSGELPAGARISLV